jgi:hypothetical protein
MLIRNTYILNYTTPLTRPRPTCNWFLYKGAMLAEVITLPYFFRLGLQKTNRGQWLFGHKGEEPSACLTQEKLLLQSFLSVLDLELQRGRRAGGAVLVTLLNDDSLLHLVAALKRHGLLPRLLETVAAATSLEVLFRQLEVAKRAFGLAFLDKHCKTIWKDPKVSTSIKSI